MVVFLLAVAHPREPSYLPGNIFAFFHVLSSHSLDVTQMLGH